MTRLHESCLTGTVVWLRMARRPVPLSFPIEWQRGCKYKRERDRKGGGRQRDKTRWNATFHSLSLTSGIVPTHLLHLRRLVLPHPHHTGPLTITGPNIWHHWIGSKGKNQLDHEVIEKRQDHFPWLVFRKWCWLVKESRVTNLDQPICCDGDYSSSFFRELYNGRKLHLEGGVQ